MQITLDLALNYMLVILFFSSLQHISCIYILRLVYYRLAEDYYYYIGRLIEWNAELFKILRKSSLK